MEVSVAALIQTALAAGGADPKRAAAVGQSFRLLARPPAVPTLGAAIQRLGGAGEMVTPAELAAAEVSGETAREVARLREAIASG